jgi:hypothetical protein
LCSWSPLYDKGFGVPKDWVVAEVSLNLAAAHADQRQRDYWTRVRDAVAQKLTLDQFAAALTCGVALCSVHFAVLSSSAPAPRAYALTRL